MSKHLRVLVVEDSEDDAVLMVWALRQGGYEVEYVRVQTRKAMAAELDRQGWDLVISDYSMPQFDAIKALAVVKEKGLDVPFILVSGTIGEETAVAALKAGANDFLVKGRLMRLVPAVDRELADAEERRARKRAEDRERQTEERFQILARATNDAVWDWNLLTDEVWWNEGVRALFGYSAVEVGADAKWWTDRIHPDDADRILSGIFRAVNSGEKFWSDEYRYRRADGSYAHVLARSFSICDAGGKVVRMVGAMVDITERKRMEEQLQQAQRMEAVGRLAGGVAHDFNNLLTIITGYSHLLLDRLAADASLRGHVQEVKKAANRAASLTSQLLAFSRRQIRRPRVMDLNTIVVEMDKMLERTIGENIHLITIPVSGLGRVKADRGQIEQVILNLVINARDAMPGGGTLTIETANVELDGAYADQRATVTPGRYVMLAVSDTGIGMDQETQSRIFEPFFTTKEKDKGTGLGLATVYGIVKQSAGHVWVYSEPGHGTTFKIYLPHVEEPIDAPEADEAPLSTARGSETVLLVEDEAALRALVRGVLQTQGYTVLEAGQADEALRICQKHKGPIDLIVTDIVMPRMSGWDLARHLAPMRPKAKVLYVSGYTEGAIAHHGALRPGVPFLEKPFAPQALARKVRQLLDAPSNTRA